MNSLHGNKFSPWEDFFVNSFGSDAISTMYVYMYGTDAGRSTCSGTMNRICFAPGKYNCFFNPLFLVPAVYYIGRH